jgi:nitrogen-specific signal transduction histidine kinase
MKSKKGVKKEIKQLSNKNLVNILEETGWTFIKTVLDTTSNPFLILDPKLRVIVANKYFYQFFKVSQKETENKLIYNLGEGQWDIPKLRELLEKILPKKTYFANLEVEHIFPKIGRKILRLNARQIYEQKGVVRTVFTPMILLVFEDITDFKQSQKKYYLQKEQ